MKKVKITVLRCSFNEALVKTYGIEELTPCAALREGQVFYSGLGKPEGFCDGAWHAIYPYVFALANGAKEFWFRDSWIRKEGMAIACCNDGLRPVYFRLEATEEEVENPFIKQVK